MSLFTGIRRVLRVGVWRRELDEELAFHFDETVAELQRTGLSPTAAREEARRRFGDERHWRRELERLDHRAEARRRWEGHYEVTRETLRLALRRLGRAPGFTAGVVLVFALGIGANATMFSILDRVLLSPPAHVRNAGEVRRILLERREPQTGATVPTEVVSYPDYLAASQSEGLGAVAAFSGGGAMLRGEDGLTLLTAPHVTGSFFSLLGVRPHLGRFFTPEEDALTVPPVAVLSHAMWQREFEGDPGVIGRTLQLESGPIPIVGVAPPGFIGIDLRPVDLWLPLHAMAGLDDNRYCIETSNCNWLRLVGRLLPGAEAAAVEAELTTRLRRERAADIEQGRLEPQARLLLAPIIAARGPLASGESRVALWLGGISLIVMLIACANVANLLLARAARQEREVGVRLALGSSRSRILVQALTESLLLSMAGAAVAALVTRWAGAALRELLLPGIVWEAPGLELRTAAAVLVLALVAGVAAGALPALRGRRADVARILKSGGRGMSAPWSRTRAALTVAQAALSVVLLIGAGLFVRSLQRVTSMDLGLDPRGVLIVSPFLENGTTSARREELVAAARERLRALPMVERVSVSRSSPFMGTTSTTVRPRGVDSVPTIASGEPTVHRVDAEYFALMRLELLRGRAIQPQDDEASRPVAVVNETMARVFWPDGETLGRCLELGFRNPREPGEELPCVEVVGVVENARRTRLIEEETMQFYLPEAQSPGTTSTLLVRAGEVETDLPATIARELRSLDPAVRHVQVQPLEELVDAQSRSWRLGATLFSLFGLLALLVASVGLYSVLAFHAAQRTFELGVRAALGARPLRLAALVLNRALALIGAGIALGLVIAWLAAPRLAPLLFETSPGDPAIYLAVAATVVAVSLVASLLPALRTSRADPMVAMRAD